MVLLLSSVVCGQVLLTGSNNISGLSWDKGAVGVGNKSCVASGIDSWVTVDVWGSSVCVWGKTMGSIGFTLGGEMLDLGGVLGWGISWDNGTIWVGNKGTGIWVAIVAKVSSAIAIGTSVSWVVAVVAVITVERGNSWDGTLGSKVSSLSSEDLWGLSWGNSTVGVGHELGAGNSGRGEESQQLHV